MSHPSNTPRPPFVKIKNKNRETKWEGGGGSCWLGAAARDVGGGEIKGCRPPNQIGPGGWAPLQHLNAHLDIPSALPALLPFVRRVIAHCLLQPSPETGSYSGGNVCRRITIGHYNFAPRKTDQCRSNSVENKFLNGHKVHFGTNKLKFAENILVKIKIQWRLNLNET